MEDSVNSASIQLKELFEDSPRAQTKDVDIFKLVEESVNEIALPPEIDIVTSYNGSTHFNVDPDKMK